ncbi:MAG: hypothetical protein M1816_001726 [Peltula sp. TS41687]|nr:MAG: hypothetical protein M1816_001726 [Peltula sp. TS41687]
MARAFNTPEGSGETSLKPGKEAGPGSGRNNCSKEIEIVDVLSIRRYNQGKENQGKETVILSVVEDAEGDQLRHFRWIHMRSENRSLDDLTRLASRLGAVDRDEQALIITLMKRVRQEGERQFIHGLSLEPMVLRCGDQNDEYKQRLKSDFGLSNAQVDKLVDKENTAAPVPKRTTWTKIARRHISLETLRFYDLPYKLDDYDPEGYVLIKRWVPEYLQERLWEHTRRIRQERQFHQRKLMLEEDKARLEIVRKKNVVRARSPALLDLFAPRSTSLDIKFHWRSDDGLDQRRSQGHRRQHPHAPAVTRNNIQQQEEPDRDVQQICRKLKKSRNDIIHVPQLWGIGMMDKVGIVCKTDCQLLTSNGTVLRAENWQTFLGTGKSTIIDISVQLLTAGSPQNLSRPRDRTSFKPSEYGDWSSYKAVPRGADDDNTHAPKDNRRTILRSNTGHSSAPSSQKQSSSEEPEQMDRPDIHMTLSRRPSYIVDYDPNRVRCSSLPPRPTTVEYEGDDPNRVRCSSLPPRPTTFEDKGDDPNRVRNTSLPPRPTTVEDEGGEQVCETIQHDLFVRIRELRRRNPFLMRYRSGKKASTISDYGAARRDVYRGDDGSAENHARRLHTERASSTSSASSASSASFASVSVHEVEDENNEIYFNPFRSHQRPKSPEVTTEELKDEVKLSERRGSSGPDIPMSHAAETLRDETRDVSATEASRLRPAAIQLYVPPVFTWATGEPAILLQPTLKSTLGANGTRGEDGSKDPDQSRMEAEVLTDVLSQIHTELEEGSAEARLYKKLPPCSQEQVEKLLGEFPTSVRQVSNLEGQSATNANSDGAAWQVSIEQTFVILLELYEFFIPSDCPCEIRDKYWGAVYALFMRIQKLCATTPMDAQGSTTGSKKSKNHRNINAFNYYVIVDITEDKESSVKVQDVPLNIPLDDCEQCVTGHKYRSIADAENHLRRKHFLLPNSASSSAASSAEPSAKPSADVLKQWILSREQLWYYQRRVDGQRILDFVLGWGVLLQQFKREIFYGVCSSGEFDRSTYRIPVSLVKAFKWTTMLVIHGAFVARSAHKQSKQYDDTDLAPVCFTANQENAPLLSRLKILGVNAGKAMDNAKNNLTLMNRANDYSESIGYEAVGPEYIMWLMMGNLRSRFYSGNGPNLIKIYQEYTRKLEFQISHHPRKRLLRDVNALAEEIRCISAVFQDQGRVLEEYGKVLNPDSFYIPSRTRRSLWGLENDLYSSILQDGQREIEGPRQLAEKCPKLAEQVKQNVEIQQEDHGKAILVFTTVTIIFLPLSFVSSLLGMNTVDIRNSDKTQWLFWIISLPLTIMVMISALLIGYHGDRIREFIADRVISSIATPRKVREQTTDNMSSSTRFEDDGDSWDIAGNGANTRDANNNDRLPFSAAATPHLERRRPRRWEWRRRQKILLDGNVGV